MFSTEGGTSQRLESLDEICREVCQHICDSLSELPLYILCGLRHQARTCALLGLRCLDVPAISTSTIHDIPEDKREQTIRKIWRFLRKEIGQEKRFFIYDDGVTRLSVVLLLKKGPLYVNRTYNIAVDDVDSSRIECVQVTNVHKLYIYVEAHLERENLLKINVVYILKKLYEAGYAELADELLRLVALLVKFRQGCYHVLPSLYKSLSKVVSNLQMFSGILKDIVGNVENISLEKLRTAIKPIRDILSHVEHR